MVRESLHHQRFHRQPRPLEAEVRPESENLPEERIQEVGRHHGGQVPLEDRQDVDLPLLVIEMY